MDILTTIAIVVVSIGYWAQTIKNFKTKNVNGLSATGYIFLSIGLLIMTYKAYSTGSTIFLVKQVATFVPACLTAIQIFLYRQPVNPKHCESCGYVVNQFWRLCPNCTKKLK
jgi:uncharacterized protein with PQ loop repeat